MPQYQERHTEAEEQAENPAQNHFIPWMELRKRLLVLLAERQFKSIRKAFGQIEGDAVETVSVFLFLPLASAIRRCHRLHRAHHQLTFAQRAAMRQNHRILRLRLASPPRVEQQQRHVRLVVRRQPPRANQRPRIQIQRLSATINRHDIELHIRQRLHLLADRLQFHTPFVIHDLRDVEHIVRPVGTFHDVAPQRFHAACIHQLLRHVQRIFHRRPAHKLHVSVDDAAAVFLLVPRGQRLLIENPSADAVRQRAFQTVADFDPHTTGRSRQRRLLVDEQQDAVVLLLVANPPRVKQFMRIIFQNHAVKIFDGDDDQFRLAFRTDVVACDPHQLRFLRLQHVAIVEHAVELRRLRRHAAHGNRRQHQKQPYDGSYRSHISFNLTTNH